MVFLYMLFFALCVAIKGGSIAYVSKKAANLINGHRLSWFLVGCFAFYTLPPINALTFTLGWGLIFMSMGEEAGAAGDYKEAWGEYISEDFGRSYGVKKAIQYGAFSGAVFALSLASWCPFIAGALFPAAYWSGSSLSRLTIGVRGVMFGEPIWGSLIGLGFYLAQHGILAVGG